MKRALISMLVLAAAVPVGCASREGRPAPAGQRAAWDLVFGGAAAGGPEASRRDLALGWRAEPDAVARQVAGLDDRPSLGRARRIYWARSPYGYTYFRRESEGRSR